MLLLRQLSISLSLTMLLLQWFMLAAVLGVVIVGGAGLMGGVPVGTAEIPQGRLNRSALNPAFSQREN
jgi:hypothetical protein